jgi:molybdate transport system ATP-binding protein
MFRVFKFGSRSVQCEADWKECEKYPEHVQAQHADTDECGQRNPNAERHAQAGLRCAQDHAGGQANRRRRNATQDRQQDRILEDVQPEIRPGEQADQAESGGAQPDHRQDCTGCSCEFHAVVARQVRHGWSRHQIDQSHALEKFNLGKPSVTAHQQRVHLCTDATGKTGRADGQEQFEDIPGARLHAFSLPVACQDAVVQLSIQALVKLEAVNLSLNNALILEQVSFELHPGECWLISGANGAGKSTFLRLVRGELWPDVGIGSRRFALVGDEPRSSPIGVRERMALVSPEAQDRLVRLELPLEGLEVVQSGIHQTDFLQYPLEVDQLARVEELLRDMNLEHLRERRISEMSKGQLRRILLARALVGKPRVLILDECFSGIDPESRADLMRNVDDAVRSGLTVMYTTHRQEERLESTSHELHLERGRIVQAGLFKLYLESDSVRVRLGLPAVTPILSLEPLIEIDRADVYLGEVLGSETAPDGMGATTKKRVLEQINWQVFSGEQWTIIGHNGAGKSTLAKLVLGEISPALGGTVRRFGRERMAIWERQSRIGLISSDVQIRHRIDAPGHVIVASGLGGSVGWARDLEPHEMQRVEELLVALEITNLRDRSGLETSHGQLKKLLIARALVTNPEIVILDEPFDYLDAHSRNLLLTLIERESDCTQFITVAHRLEDIPRNVTHGLWLEAGRVRFAGLLEELLARAPQFAGRGKIKD